METQQESSSFAKTIHRLGMRYQAFLDRINPHRMMRWGFLSFLLVIFLFRVFFFQGWYIVTYGLFIYLLNLFLLFLSPKFDPEEEEGGFLEMDGDLPTISAPRRKDDEYRPFIRRLPEFNFWLSLTKAVIVSLLLTSSSLFDIPVYWPILLGYWVMLLVITMRKRIQHMIKYRYLPWDVQKKTYSGNEAQSSVNPIFGVRQNIFSQAPGGMGSKFS